MNTLLPRLIARPLILVATALACVGAQAQVGLKRLSWAWPGAEGATDTVQAAAWYPSSAQATPMRLGPMTMTVAPGAPRPPTPRPLVLLSHGAGGSEWAQAWLAQALAARGYVVVALQHPHDHPGDDALQRSPTYFVDRARQLSHLLDTLQADPDWAGAIDFQRVAVVGHSAGGATALLLAGARIAPARLAAHCAPGSEGARDDAAFCGLGARRAAPVDAAANALSPDARDPRIRAAVAAVPVAAMFDPDSLHAITVPMQIENAGADAVLTPRFHGEAVCAQAPGARCTTTPGAGHRAFAQVMPGQGDTAHGTATPQPFDPEAYQHDAAERVLRFLDAALH